jgi:two-component sensor histidine kinase
LRFFLVIYFIFLTTLFSQEEITFINNRYEINKKDSTSNQVQAKFKKRPSSNKSNVVNEYIQYSKMLRQQGKMDSSFFYLEKVKPYLDPKKDKDTLLLYYSLKAELARFNSDKYLVSKILNESENWFTKQNEFEFNSDILAYYYNRKAACYQYNDGNKDTLNIILSLCNKVINLESKIVDKSIVAYSMNERAQLYNYKIDSTKGIAYHKEAYEYAVKNKLYLPMSDIAFQIGMYYNRRDYISKSVDYYTKSFLAAEKSKNLAQLTNVSDNLSSAYAKNGDYKNALKYKQIQFDYVNKQNSLKTSNLLREADFQLRFENQSNKIKTKEKEIESTQRYLFLALIIALLITLGIVALVFYYKKIKRQNLTLKSLSNENKFLLSEANHRINNNLQLIIILIESQLKKIEKQQQTSLKNILSKIDAIATLHRHLYQNKDKKSINCKNYLKEIIVKFNDLLKENTIQLDFKMEDVLLPTDTAMYLGLLLTELLINSVKHAFEEKQQKVISFNLKQIDAFLYFEYLDNGNKANGKKVEPKLVKKLCRQLRIDPTINTTSGFLLTFKKKLIK